MEPHARHSSLEPTRSNPHRPAVRRPVPLRTWIWSAAFASVLFYVLTSVFVAPSSEAFQDYNSERIAGLRERAAGADVVILLGDSRLRYATHRDEVLGARIAKASGRRVQTLRIVNNWAVYDDFAPLLSSLLDLQPSLMLIQFELMSKERAKQGRLLIGRQYLLWRFFGTGTWNPGNLDQELLQQEQRCEVLAREDLETRRGRVFSWVHFDARGRAAQRMQDLVQAARARGIRVELLDVPITREASTGLPGPDRPAGASPLGPPFDIPDSSFCDLVHLSPDGRDVYSDWLIATIAGALQNEAS